MMSFGSGSGGATVSFAGGIRAMTKMKNRNAPRCVARDTTKLPPRRPFSLAPEGTSPTRKCAFGLGRGSGISDMSAVSGTVVIVADAVPGCKAAISMPQQHRKHRRKSWPWEQERPRLRTATGDDQPSRASGIRATARSRRSSVARTPRDQRRRNGRSRAGYWPSSQLAMPSSRGPADARAALTGATSEALACTASRTLPCSTAP